MNKRLALLPALALIALLSACGASVTPTFGAPLAAVPAREMLYLMAGGGGGALKYPDQSRIVAFHPGDGASARVVTLPDGIATADHTRVYSAAPDESGQTAISEIDTRTGATLRAFSIPGAYTTSSTAAAPGATTYAAELSPDGRWLALRALQQDVSTSMFALVDTQARKLAQTIQLAGDFDLDALAPGGGTLYLLQNLRDAGHHYYVRAYDLTTHALMDTIIVDKTEIESAGMAGTALTRQMAPDGRVAYTLYLDLARNVAFVHILPLGDGRDFVPFARCVDLPVGQSPDLLRAYTLALAPDGATLYAANGALGVVSAISLNGVNVFDDKVVATGHFSPDSAGQGTALARVLRGGAALAANGKTLYLVGVQGIVALRTGDLQVLGRYLTDQAPTSVAASANAALFYISDPARGVTVLDVANGQAATLENPVQAPLGIAWVAG